MNDENLVEKLKRTTCEKEEVIRKFALDRQNVATPLWPSMGG
jgi:hypothetical protein